MKRIFLAAALLASIPFQAQAQGLGLATGSPGGGFLDYGTAVSRAVADRIDIRVRQTSGTAENLRLVENREIECALAVAGPAYEAWNGLEAWTEGRKFASLRAVAPMYETSFHAMAPAASAAAGIAGLAGKRVGVGPARGTGELMFRAVMEATGLSATLEFGTPAAQGEALAAGALDAFWFGAGLPVPAFAAAAARADLRVLGLSGAAREATIRRLPYLAPATIPANTYRGQSEPVESIAVWNLVVCRADAPTAAVEAFARALFERGPAIAAAMPAAGGTRAANAGRVSVLPFHPAVVAVYRAAGIDVRAQ
jgi:uncharacterized protein